MDILLRGSKNRHGFKIRLATLGIVFLLTFMSFSVQASEDVSSLNGQGTATTAVFVRSGPDKSYDDMGQLNKGESVSVTGETSGGWYQVTFNGKEGYVYKDYINFETTEAANESAVSEGTETETTELEEGEPEEGYSLTNMNPTWIKVIVILLVIIAVLALAIFTVIKLRRGDDYDDYDDYDEYDDDYEDDYDDGYEDEYEEEAYYEDEEYPEEAEDDYEDSYERKRLESHKHARGTKEPRHSEPVRGRDYEEEDRDLREENLREEEPETLTIREKKEKNHAGRDKKYVIREEDYRLHIDPKFFEEKEPIEQPAMVTGYLARKMQEEEVEKANIDRKKQKAGEADGGMSGEKQKELDDAMKKLSELQEEIERLKKQ